MRSGWFGIGVLIFALIGGLAQAKTPKLMIIGLDGTRPDALQVAQTPNLESLVATGVAAYGSLTGDVSLSGPGWSSMLTGVWCDKHRVIDNDASWAASDFATYPHFFRRLKDHDGTLVTASVSHWDKINTEIVAAHADASDHTITVGTDQAVADEVAQLLASTDVDAVFMQFDDVDHAGHDCCFTPENDAYVGAIETVDGQIGQVLDALYTRSSLADEDWLIIVSTDHGGGGFVNDQHGSPWAEDRIQFVILAGDNVTADTVPAAPRIVDVAVTALRQFGITPDPAWNLDGQIIGFADAPGYRYADTPRCGIQKFNYRDPAALISRSLWPFAGPNRDPH